jgi:cob(I)alamin adenosyltransferase
MSTKIYTKTGDKGTTSLIGGTKVPKSHLRIEAYGTVDELNSFIGLLRDQLSLTQPASSRRQPANVHQQPTTTPPTPSSQPTLETIPSQPSPETIDTTSLETIDTTLLEIQDRLFTIGSSLACDPEKEIKLSIPDLREEDITLLEKSIDQMDSLLPPMKSFVLPGGHVVVSSAHIVRCVCRRAERICVRMHEEGLFVEPLVIRYLNRLSDYFFELARYTGHLLQAREIPWKPRI